MSDLDGPVPDPGTTRPPGLPRTDAELAAAADWVSRSLASWRGLWFVYTCTHIYPSRPCHWCASEATCTIAVNVWGSGVERPACAEHARYHGNGMDS
jgi:hypothetical protein